MATSAKPAVRDRNLTDRRRAENTADESQPASSAQKTSWLQSTLGLGLLGSLLMYAAQPPWNLWPLAWIAPIPWLLLCLQPKLEGRRPYTALWLAGFAYWLGAIHWLRLPHWLTYCGWLALSFYLAFYIPVFVGLVRIAVHRLQISIILAAPIVWTGLELAKGHLLSGFTMGSLEHTQIRWLAFIQGADFIGGYGIAGAMILVAACLARAIPWRGQKFALWPAAPLIAVMVVALGYGYWRMSGDHTRPGATVALIQGTAEMNLDSDQDLRSAIYKQYFDLSRKALIERPDISLVVWPETMYRFGLFTCDPDIKPTKQWLDRFGDSPQSIVDTTHHNLQVLADDLDQTVKSNSNGAATGPALLLGMEALHCSNEADGSFAEHIYNSAQFVDPDGKPLARYDKMHPVMFGEYIPLAEYLPFLYKITPLTGGLTVGTQGVSQELGGIRYAPDICYETVIPHLIRKQVNQLRQQGQEPDVLVNVTNDGWFRGSSELDMHLACGVFRAIEMRKPLVIAANTGFSAWIDADGKILRQSPRFEPSYIIADVQLDNRHSLYLDYGDWFSVLCLSACLGLAATGLRDRFARRKNGAG
jgi:apolipoprotein N-acyltransferase